jgi:chromosome segregation ATPase
MSAMTGEDYRLISALLAAEVRVLRAEHETERAQLRELTAERDTLQNKVYELEHTIQHWEVDYEGLKDDLDALREEALTAGRAFKIGGLWMNATTAVDFLTEERDLVRAELAETKRIDNTELREAAQVLSVGWRRKARELRNYDVGMHEVVNCANELDAVLKAL